MRPSSKRKGRWVRALQVTFGPAPGRFVPRRNDRLLTSFDPRRICRSLLWKRSSSGGLHPVLIIPCDHVVRALLGWGYDRNCASALHAYMPHHGRLCCAVFRVASSGALVCDTRAQACAHVKKENYLLAAEVRRSDRSCQRPARANRNRLRCVSRIYRVTLDPTLGHIRRRCHGLLWPSTRCGSNIV